MTESGKDRINILFQLLEYTEGCLRSNYRKTNPQASENDVLAHLSQWYSQSEHFSDREYWKERNVP